MPLRRGAAGVVLAAGRGTQEAEGAGDPGRRRPSRASRAPSRTTGPRPEKVPLPEVAAKSENPTAAFHERAKERDADE